MAHRGGDMNRVGSGFDLPDEILSVIPTDPYDQLDVARKITSMAIASRVTNLESEAGSLRHRLQDKDRRIQELENKVSRLESAYQEAELRLGIAHEDNMKLAKEKNSLDLTIKKLGRDIAKMETFKRQLMLSLNDEHSPVNLQNFPLQQTETVDIGTYDQSISKAYPENDVELNGYRNERINDNVSKKDGQKFSTSPYRSGTPKIITSVYTRPYSAIGSPERISEPASPRTQYEGRGSLSSWFPSSKQSSAASSPPRGNSLSAGTSRIDGKEFFRQARSRLTLEQFSAFLANIKELNAKKQSREEALRKAEEIFGMENNDLYISFQGLLNRNMH